jgi:solute:Na+ symporter, SSS family
MNLNYIDIAIIIIYILLIFVSGSLVKKYIKGIDDYLVAGRSMGFHLGLLSLMCSEIGIITFVYYAELGFDAGFASLIAAIPPVIAYIVLGKTGWVIKPLLEMKIKTIPEFFSIKFSKGVRFYVGIFMAVGGILNFGVFPGVEARFINIVTGVPQHFMLLTMVILLTIVLLYTLVGGMVSVIITNYIQYALLSIGMILITVFGIIKVDWNSIVHYVSANMGEKGMNPFFSNAFSSNFGIGFIIWQILEWTALLIGWQAISIRLFSSKDSETGKKIYRWSGLMFFSRGILPIFWGIIALAYFGLHGIKVSGIDSLGNLIVAIVPNGLLGLMFAALLAASMSTYSSYLLSWSSVVSQDIIGSIIKFITGREASSKKQLMISRITMTCVMIFIIWFSLFYEMGGYIYFYLQMTGMLFIPGVIISVVLGIYWKRSRSLGAYLSITFGAIPPVTYLFLPPALQNSMAAELGWGGFVLALIGMIAGSLIQNKFNPLAKSKSNPELIEEKA